MSLWSVIHAFRAPWKWVNSLLDTRAPHLAATPHIFLDKSVCNLRSNAFPANRIRRQQSTKQRNTTRLTWFSRLQPDIQQYLPIISQSPLFYSNGFGDNQMPYRFYQFLRQLRDESLSLRHETESTIVRTLPQLEISLSTPKYKRSKKCYVQTGTFPTLPHLIHEIPHEAQKGQFQIIVPENLYGQFYKQKNKVFFSSNQDMDNTSAAASDTHSSTIPIVIILAGTGEHGFSRRSHFLGYPLAKQGVASIILESPFYGCRRPKDQLGSKLKYVSDLPALGRVTIEETRGIIRWLREHTFCGPIVLAGTSMGGLHSAITASITPLPLGVASWLGPTSAAPVFTQGVLASAVDWDALRTSIDRSNYKNDITINQIETEPRTKSTSSEWNRSLDACNQTLSSSLENGLLQYENLFINDTQRLMQNLTHQQICIENVFTANHTSNSIHYSVNRSANSDLQQYMDRFLHLTNILHYPAPVKPSAATFVAARYDQYVPPDTQYDTWDEVSKRWNGCEILWTNGGHVSATLWPTEARDHCAIILDVIQRLGQTIENK